MQTRVKDFSEASFCLASGEDLIGVEEDERGFKIFIFRGDLEAQIRNYYNNATIPARALHHAMRDLKSLIYNR